MGKIRSRSLRARLTGISTPFGGASWEYKEPERNLVKDLITFLEDRRVLFNPYDLEIPQHCVDSVIEIRRYLTDLLKQLRTERELIETVRALRTACRKFVDKLSQHDTHRPFGGTFAPMVEMATAPGELRAIFGVHLAGLAVAYGIDVEEDLALIMPEQPTD